MSDYQSKRYYWLKLHKDFFQNHVVRVLEGMPNGRDYAYFWLKLMAESVSHGGCLRLNDTIPYNEEMLASITNTNIDIVRSAVKVLQSMDVLDVWDDGTFYMKTVQGMIGSETNKAEQMREYRARLKENNVEQLENKGEQCSQEIRDKSIDIRDNNIYSPVSDETVTLPSGKKMYAPMSTDGMLEPELFGKNEQPTKSIEFRKYPEENIITGYVIDYLNQKTGTRYKASNAKTISLVKARLKEGFNLEDFKTVIDTKVDEWGKDEKMRQYLRPVTLFCTKFESYLNQKDTKAQPKQADDELLKLLGG